MKFSDIIGHKEEIRRLREMADSEKLPHALLLHGPSGIGKFTTALAFVQYLGCTSRRNGDSCGVCPACRQASELSNPDVHFVYPVTKKRSPKPLSTDFAEEWRAFLGDHPYMPEEEWLKKLDAGNSRPLIYVTESAEILRLSSLSAYGTGYKIFVVWLPEKMNAEAANKLLKVIEEPHSDTLFIFVSNNPAEIIPTIKSRLQGIEFKKLSDAEIAAYLEGEGVDPDAAEDLARIAKGDINKASAFTSHDGEFAEFAGLFIEVMRAAYARVMPELRRLSDAFASFGREKSLRLLDYFGRMLRESFISNLHQDRLLAMSAQERSFVAKFGPFINNLNIENLSKEVAKAHEDISRNANQKIVWFDLFIQLSRLIRKPV
ncbi:MAG: DNA polymerase III subunit delta [Muribaculaceae bacterium]|nr:DNA polymerase III subunit delta [Muribaculaceae bacterium]